MREMKFDIAEYKKQMTGHLAEQGAGAELFWQALDFAEKAHAGQTRRTGEPYIQHPCSVAQILVEELDVRDPEILAAALLHDTVEDVKEISTELIGEHFGKNVEAIVDGCTKVRFTGDKQHFYKEVHRKIFSGAAARLEVMLVKLADRLHNLRTLNAMPRDRRQRVAEETLDIYAPMAKVMGLFNLKRELYDLALTYKFPRQSHKVQANIRQLETSPEVLEIIERLRAEMKNAWLDAEIIVRAKGLWGYFDPVHKVLDKEIEHPLEFIILIEDIHSCYRALGIVNQNFPPIPRSIRDFIANPKPTGYQGLHARANIKGHNYLFKIRTPQMAQLAQKGMIKGWSSGERDRGTFENDLQEMFDILGTEDGLSHRDMIAASGRKELYTYTPGGDRICLPKQSIILDFAYRVHSEMGSRCIAAEVGQQRVGPDYVLKDGDRIKIIRQDRPVLFDPHLLDLCQTPRARSGLTRGFRIRRQALALEIGESILQQELKRYGIPFTVLEKDEAVEVLEEFGKRSLPELFRDVGEGQVRLKELIQVVKRILFAEQQTLQPPTGILNHIYLDTLDPVCVKFSACCKPVPTDKGLLGLLSERGLSVHSKECERLGELKLQREDVVELRWQLKETLISKPQDLYVLRATRNRLLLLLAVAPENMKLLDIIMLSSGETRTPAWEINFSVPNLYDLRNILQHFSKAEIAYEFVLEQ